MCRGKAVKDFKGPDCRFLGFKEGESIYVYYKLIGRTNELWAGSVSFLYVFTNIEEPDILINVLNKNLPVLPTLKKNL